MAKRGRKRKNTEVIVESREKSQEFQDLQLEDIVQQDKNYNDYQKREVENMTEKEQVTKEGQEEVGFNRETKTESKQNGDEKIVEYSLKELIEKDCVTIYRKQTGDFIKPVLQKHPTNVEQLVIHETMLLLISTPETKNGYIIGDIEINKLYKLVFNIDKFDDKTIILDPRAKITRRNINTEQFKIKFIIRPKH